MKTEEKNKLQRQEAQLKTLIEYYKGEGMTEEKAKEKAMKRLAPTPAKSKSSQTPGVS